MRQISRKSILVINNDFTKLKTMYQRLIIKYSVTIAPDFACACKLMNKFTPDVILCQMPNETLESGGFFDANPVSGRLIDTRLLLVADSLDDISPQTLSNIYKSGWVEFVPASLPVNVLMERLGNCFRTNQNKSMLMYQLNQKTLELEKRQDALINALTIITEFRDSNTGGHLKRTRLYTEAMIKQLLKQGYPIAAEYAANIVRTAPLHDVGKIAISDVLLHKPTKFTSSEYDLVKLHVIYGQKIINGLFAEGFYDPVLEVARELITTHHEKWDGTGYPNRLKQTEIPISGRIMAIADVYDALVASRAYKDELSHAAAIKIMLSERGKAFDPELVDIFEQINTEFEKIKLDFIIR